MPIQTGGGAATYAGTNYQSQVAMWLAVRALAEADVTPLWGWPASTTLDYIRCETGEPVDDILVANSGGGHGFLQAKHNLDLGTTADSDFASVLDQFVRQFHAHAGGDGRPSWNREINPDQDRLVLATNSGASAKIRTTLPTVLTKLANLTPTQPLDQSAWSADESATFSTFQTHVKRSWQALKQADPTDEEMRALAKLIRVQVLDLDVGQTHERESLDSLNRIVKDPAQGGLAWDVLFRDFANAAAKRNGASRAQLQQLLLSAGIDLHVTRNYRADIERLKKWSSAALESLATFSEIRTSGGAIKITRQSTSALKDAAVAGSLLVVGQPGAGKSGALHDIALQLRGQADVLVLATSQFEAGSLGSMRNEIGCTHEIVDLLVNWPGTRPALLIIDALDAARSDASARAFRDLIEAIMRAKCRWNVIASIRKFDLRRSGKLQSLFAGSPPTDYKDAEFPTVRHFEVPTLTAAELQEAGQQSSQLAEVIAGAGNELLSLLQTPFNLRLLVELLESGVSVSSLTPIRTQIELLERYWQERVIGEDSQGDAREAVLRLATAEMVNRRALRIDRAVVANDPSASAPLSQVLSLHLLAEWQSSPGAPANRYILTYGHHILFDFAVSRFYTRGSAHETARWLAAEPDLLLAIRPSIVLYFHHLWAQDVNREAFWTAVFEFIQCQGLPTTAKIIGPSVGCQLIQTVNDCDPLLRAMGDPSNPYHAASQPAFQYLVSAARSLSRNLTGLDAAPWCKLLETASRI